MSLGILYKWGGLKKIHSVFTATSISISFFEFYLTFFSFFVEGQCGFSLCSGLACSFLLFFAVLLFFFGVTYANKVINYTCR